MNHTGRYRAIIRWAGLLLLLLGLFAGGIVRGQETPEEALERARSFAGGNADWLVFEQDFDGVTMVLVPAGCFTMGSTEAHVAEMQAMGAIEGRNDRELPAHEICFEAPFWIDKTEVTNAQFAQGGGEARYASLWREDNFPRQRISWGEARDFCTQRGGALPTEAQWEYAARGPDGLIYPWGDVWLWDLSVHSGNSGRRPAAAGGRVDGASWVGALDMAGSLWEWTGSLYGPYPYAAGDGREAEGPGPRVVRGGSFQSTLVTARSVQRLWLDPAYRSGDVGFRCVRAVEG